MNEEAKDEADARPAPKRQADIPQLVGSLIHAIGTIQFSLAEFAELIAKRRDEKTNEFGSFLNTHGLRKENSPTGFKIEIPVGKSGEFERTFNAFRQSMDSKPLVRRGLILLLVSKWDAYIADTLRWLYENKPEIINASNRSLTYSDLKSFTSLDDARKKIVEDEVQAILRESHVSHFEYIEKKLGMKLREGLDIWPQFVELTQRRHLLAHTDGIVSQQYLDICKDHGFSFSSDIKIGRRLHAEDEYFYSACDCLSEIGLKLAQVLWRKLKPDEVTQADNHLLATSLDLIRSGRYKPSIEILKFALKAPIKLNDARGRLVATINLAQAHKWLGDNDQCSNTLNKEDWSAASEEFLLAVSVLKDEFDDAASRMKKIGKDGPITKEDYDEWPVFREFRKTDAYLQSYRCLFGTDNEMKVIPQSAIDAGIDTSNDPEGG